MLRPLGSPRLNACQEFGKRTAQSHPVRTGKSNVLRSGPIARFSEGLRSKAERWRNATRGFVLNPNDSMRERLTYLSYLCAPPSLRDTGRSSTTQAAAR